MTAANRSKQEGNSDLIRFVRITFQECREADKRGAYVGRGTLQDIRLIDGWFRIADDHDPAGIAYEIVHGELVQRATSTLPGLAHSHLEVLPASDPPPVCMLCGNTLQYPGQLCTRCVPSSALKGNRPK